MAEDGKVSEVLPPNVVFENYVRDTMLKAPEQLDKYAIASLLLLQHLVDSLPPEMAAELLTQMTTEYPDREFVDDIEYLPSYLDACETYLGYKSVIGPRLKSRRDMAMVAFERKREAAMVTLLQEGGEKKQDESGWLRTLLGVKDDV